jgi:hypothetical protein
MVWRRVVVISGLLVAAALGPGQAADLPPDQAAAAAAEARQPVSAPQPSLFSPKPYATDPDWGLYAFGGVSAGRTRLIELIPMPWTGDYGDNYFVGGAVERRLGRVYQHFIFELEGGAGYRFKEVNAPEFWGGIYLRFDGFPWNHIVYTTAAINTGLSYATKVSEVEKDAGSDRGNPNGSNLLHYFGPEITFADPNNRNTEFVVRWHHRSGMFGLFNGVWGGSNVVTGGIRQRF